MHTDKTESMITTCLGRSLSVSICVHLWFEFSAAFVLLLSAFISGSPISLFQTWVLQGSARGRIARRLIQSRKANRSAQLLRL